MRQKRIEVLHICAGQTPKRLTIDNTLQSKQDLVGGLVQILYPFEDADICILANDAGKLLGLEANRALFDNSGKVYDIICGDFIVLRAPADSDEFAGLTEKQMTKYINKYVLPEMFIMIDGQLVVLPNG